MSGRAVLGSMILGGLLGILWLRASTVWVFHLF